MSSFVVTFDNPTVTVEADSATAVARELAVHFGALADGKEPPNGLDLHVTIVNPDAPEPETAEGDEPAAPTEE